MALAQPHETSFHRRHDAHCGRARQARPAAPSTDRPAPALAFQDVLVGVAGKAIDACPPGGVLVLDGNATSVPVALLARRQAAGVVSNGPLRNAADVARAGLPAWQRPSGPARPLAIDAGDFLSAIAAASSSFPRPSSTRSPRKRPKRWPTRSSSPNR